MMTLTATRQGAQVEEVELFWACLRAACLELLSEEGALCALDRAIGDGDHGTNLARGARAILAAEAELRSSSIAQALESAGTLVVNQVGGASGPLYGTLLITMGRSWPSDPDTASISGALTAGVAAVGRRGRSTAGEKTLLDVLIPAAAALQASATTRSAEESVTAMLAAADAGFESTRPLRASKGRAAYVGERSIGHYDPGAASMRLCLHAVARALGRSSRRAGV